MTYTLSQEELDNLKAQGANDYRDKVADSSVIFIAACTATIARSNARVSLTPNEIDTLTHHAQTFLEQIGVSPDSYVERLKKFKGQPSP